MASSTTENPVLHTLDDMINKKLLDARRIYISEAVDSDSATDIIRKLWYLELSEPGKPILLVISSPGGSVDAGMAIWDQIQAISSPVTTLVTGLAASMGSVISLAAAPGRRFASPNARIMIHQPSLHGVMRGQATDLEIQAREIKKTRDRLVDLYVKATGKDRDIIDRALDRDNWYSAAEAKEFGLIDAIIDDLSQLDK